MNMEDLKFKSEEQRQQFFLCLQEDMNIHIFKKQRIGIRYRLYSYRPYDQKIIVSRTDLIDEIKKHDMCNVTSTPNYTRELSKKYKKVSFDRITRSHYPYMPAVGFLRKYELLRNCLTPKCVMDIMGENANM